MDIEGLSSQSSQDNKQIIKELQLLITSLDTQPNSTETFSVIETIINFIKNLQTHKDIFRILEELVLKYKTLQLPLNLYSRFISLLFDVVKSSVSNTKLYSVSWKCLIQSILSFNQNNTNLNNTNNTNLNDQNNIDTILNEIVEYIIIQLIDLFKTEQNDNAIFSFHLKLLIQFVKKLNGNLFYFKDKFAELLKQFLEMKKENSNYFESLKELLNCCDLNVLEDSNNSNEMNLIEQLPFPLQFYSLQIVYQQQINQFKQTNANERIMYNIQTIEMILKLITQSEELHQHVLDEMEQMCYLLLSESMKYLSKIISICNRYLQGNYVTKIFVSKLLYFICMILNPNERCIVINKLTNDISFLLHLLVQDNTNDLPLQNIYKMHLHEMYGNQYFVRMLKNTQMISYFHSQILSYSLEQLCNVITECTVEILPKEIISQLFDLLLNYNSFNANDSNGNNINNQMMISTIQNEIFHVLEKRQQQQLLSILSNNIMNNATYGIEYLPFIFQMNQDQIKHILEHLSIEQHEGIFGLCIFFKYAECEDKTILKEVGKSIRSVFIEFLKLQQSGIVKVIPEGVVMEISNEMIAKDVEDIVRNAREEIRRNGNGVEVWNELMKKLSSLLL